MALNIFCTLFNQLYFSRGLALYESLVKHCADFHLYIFVFDDQTLQILRGMGLAEATVISLAEFEDDDLLRIKPGRTAGEYCWTCTPSTINYVLKKYPVEMCTYLDADIYFFADPKVLIDEMGANSVLITEHRYTPEYDKSATSGKYCVQFITFRNDEAGQKVLSWWRQVCLDWCYNRHEDGKFGDQMYLNDWPERFAGVHVLQHLGGGVAPWNVQQYKFSSQEEQVWGKEKKSGAKFPLVFYHFHNLYFYTNRWPRLSNYLLPWSARNLLYRPYLCQIAKMKQMIQNIDQSFDPNGAKKYVFDGHRLKGFLIRQWRKVKNCV